MDSSLSPCKVFGLVFDLSLLGHDLLLRQFLEDPPPAVNAMGLDRVVEYDRFLAFRIGTDGEEFFSAVGAELHLVGFRARCLDTFDSEAIGEVHSRGVMVELEFGA